MAADEDYPRVIDEMIEHYTIAPSPVLYDVYERDGGWLRSFYIALKRRPDGCYWFRRTLPWDVSAPPSADVDRLAWLTARAEKLYDHLYDSLAPRADFRVVKTAVKEAIQFATKSGRRDEAARLTQRLVDVTAVYEQQLCTW